MERTDGPELTVITPMYNEGAQIAENVRRILGALDALDVSWEYVLVNDGSTDDSLAKARSALAERSNCQLIHYDMNRGRGYALRKGFAAARGRYVVTTESDLSWGPGIIEALYRRLLRNDCDIVVASVYLPGGGFENVPSGRRWLSRLGNHVLRWCFGGGLTMLSGMTRGYRRDVLERLYLESDRKEIHVEILAKATALGFRVTEIPATIRWAPPGPGARRGGVGSMLRFVLPHLVSSYNHGATRILMWSSIWLAVLGVLTTGFGILNKLVLLTPQPMPNLVIYGLVLIVLSSVFALFGGVSIQLGTLTRSLTHTQSQIEELRRTVSLLRPPTKEMPAREVEMRVERREAETRV